MFAPGIVIFEKTRRWEAILKRHFLGTSIQVRPCRLASQTLEVLQAMPGSVALIDLGTGAGQGLRLITQIYTRHPRSSIITVAPAALADLEWPAREFGVAAFLVESVSHHDLGRICASYLDRPNVDAHSVVNSATFH